MSAAAGKASPRPQPPDDLDGEALLEWERIVGELEAAGRLELYDRSILTVYVTMWAAHRDAARDVLLKGPTAKLPNGYRAATASYDVMKQTAQQIRALLKEMGLTAAVRPKTKEPENEELEI